MTGRVTNKACAAGVLFYFQIKSVPRRESLVVKSREVVSICCIRFHSNSLGLTTAVVAAMVGRYE